MNFLGIKYTKYKPDFVVILQRPVINFTVYQKAALFRTEIGRKNTEKKKKKKRQETLSLGLIFLRLVC